MNDHVRPCNLKPQQRDLTPVLRRPVEPAPYSHQRADIVGCLKRAKTGIRTMAHSISSSAAICIDCGTASPSVFAVLVLMTSSNLVGRSTGRSFGLVPRKTFPA